MGTEETGVSAGAEGGETQKGQDTQSNDAEASVLAEAWKKKAEVADKALAEQRQIQAGLDQKVTQLSKQVEVLEGERDGLKAEVDKLKEITESDDVDQQFKQLLEASKKEIDDLKAKLQAAEKEAEALKADNERLNIVAAEFPTMAPLVKAGALPSASDPDAFREAMQELSEKFAPADVAKQKELERGARPPASPGADGTPDSLSTIRKNMMQAHRDGDNEAFNKYQEEWFAALAGREKKQQAETGLFA